MTAAEYLETLIDVTTITGISIAWLYLKDVLKMFCNNAKLQKSLLEEKAKAYALRNYRDLRDLHNGRDACGEAPPAYSPSLETD